MVGDSTAARREGKVVVAASPHAEVRKTLPSAFEQRFGIALEYLGGRSSDTIARLQAERRVLGHPSMVWSVFDLHCCGGVFCHISVARG